MKRFTLLLAAVALVLGLAQCKKEEPVNEVFITLSVEGDDGKPNTDVKHTVNGQTGAVTYTDGDVIYVGNGGKYVGKLTRTNGKFSGTLTNPVTTDHLYFYFVGNATLISQPVVGSSNSFVVDISNQTAKLPVISFGQSANLYTNGTTNYNCLLLNKCGLVQFKYDANGDGIAGNDGVGGGSNYGSDYFDSGNWLGFRNMLTRATVNFSGTPGITPNTTRGEIFVRPVAGGGADTYYCTYMIALPQAAMTPVVDHIGYKVTCTQIPAVTNNAYIKDRVFSRKRNGLVTDRDFTINGNGAKVKFSLGNLRCNRGTWEFHYSQHYVIGQGNDGNIGNDWTNANPTATSCVDWFAFGTSGQNHGANKYQFYATGSDSDFYAYGDKTKALNVAPYTADWGYNEMANAKEIYPGNNQWRTLTDAEWMYLYSGRSNAANLRKYGSVKSGVSVMGQTVYVNTSGWFLFPDNYVKPVFCSDSYSEITGTDWICKQMAGAVFLPMAGSSGNSGINSHGDYWTASPGNADANSNTTPEPYLGAKSIYMHSSNWFVYYYSGSGNNNSGAPGVENRRSIRRSVRLVKK